MLPETIQHKIVHRIVEKLSPLKIITGHLDDFRMFSTSIIKSLAVK